MAKKKKAKTAYEMHEPHPESQEAKHRERIRRQNQMTRAKTKTIKDVTDEEAQSYAFTWQTMFPKQGIIIAKNVQAEIDPKGKDKNFALKFWKAMTIVEQGPNRPKGTASVGPKTIAKYVEEIIKVMKKK